jgi:hypothetical protein
MHGQKQVADPARLIFRDRKRFAERAAFCQKCSMASGSIFALSVGWKWAAKCVRLSVQTA